jgi:hypothetical protein
MLIHFGQMVGTGSKENSNTYTLLISLTDFNVILITTELAGYLISFRPLYFPPVTRSKRSLYNFIVLYSDIILEP